MRISIEVCSVLDTQGLEGDEANSARTRQTIVLGFLVSSTGIASLLFGLLYGAQVCITASAPIFLFGFFLMVMSRIRCRVLVSRATSLRQHNTQSTRADWERSIQYGSFLKAFPIAVLLIWYVLFLSIAVFIHPSPPEPSEAPILFAGFMLIVVGLTTLVFIEAYGTEGKTSKEGFEIRTWWRGRRFVAWEEVQKISYSNWLPGFVVETRGKKIRVSDQMDGITYFAEEAVARLTPDKWAAASGHLMLLVPKGPYD